VGSATPGVFSDGFANKRLISARVKKSAEEEGRPTENKGVDVALFLGGEGKK
jgi:hypothetical protein